MKISYAITVCNEFIEIQRLLGFLLENKRDQDEIVILYHIMMLMYLKYLELIQ